MKGRMLVVCLGAVMVLAIAGCGGDGGGGSESVNYNGVNTPAVVDTTGAVSFAREMTLESISGDSAVDTSILPLAVPPPSLDGFADPDVVARILIGALGVRTTRSQVVPLGAVAEPLAYLCQDFSSMAGSVSGTVSGRVCGDFDGQAFTNVDYLSAAFQNFSNDGISLLDGAMILDATGSPVSIIFRDLNFDDSGTGEDRYLDGIATEAEAGSVTTVNLNLFIRDNLLGAGTWYNNLVIVEEDFTTYVTTTVDGRIYDFVHGYVDVDTTEPFETMSGANYPYNGTIRFTAAGGRVVRLEVFNDAGFNVFVDLDGNGTDDWQTSSPVPWVQPT